jgi:hypothetical protein
MVEVRREGVNATAEVNVVREEDNVVPESVGDGKAVKGVAPK